MKTIKLTQGKQAIIDEADYEAISKFKWFAIKSRERLWYAARQTSQIPGGKQRMLYMHNAIPGLPTGKRDHKNGDGLDNRRDNLRLCTNQQNGWNRRKQHTPSSSRFKGVSWVTRDSIWRVYIGLVGGVRKYVGDFKSEETAARAYDSAAKQFFGEFARPNFP